MQGEEREKACERPRVRSHARTCTSPRRSGHVRFTSSPAHVKLAYMHVRARLPQGRSENSVPLVHLP